MDYAAYILLITLALCHTSRLLEAHFVKQASMYTQQEPPGLPGLLGEVDNKGPRDPTEDIGAVGTIAPQDSAGRDGRDDAAGQQSTLGLRGRRGSPVPNRLPGPSRQKEFMDTPGPKETPEASVRHLPYHIQAEEEFDNYDYE